MNVIFGTSEVPSECVPLKLSLNENYKCIKDDLWRNNSRPSKSQVSTLLAFLSEAEKDLDCLSITSPSVTENIEYMDTTEPPISNLRYTRAQKQKQIDTCRFLMSSVRLLPSDILIQIFSNLPRLTLPDLCHICSAWRAAVLLYPGLWRSESYDLIHSEASDLCIVVDVSKQRMHNFAYIFQSAAPLFTLVSKISLSNVEITSFLTAQPNFFPQLHTIEFYNTTHERNADITVFRGAARLRNVTVNGRRAFADFILQALPYDQLTVLNIGEDSQLASPIALPCILKSVNLHNISLTMSLPTTFQNLKPPLHQDHTVVYPQMTKFNLHVPLYHADILSELLSKISFPALNSFELMTVFQEYPLPLAVIQSSLSTSFASLQYLKLSPSLLDLPDYLAILSACTFLEHLSIPFTHYPRQNYKSFTLLDILRELNNPAFQLAELRKFSLSMVITSNPLGLGAMESVLEALSNLLEFWMGNDGRRRAMDTVDITLLRGELIKKEEALKALSGLKERLRLLTRVKESGEGWIVKAILADAAIPGQG